MVFSDKKELLALYNAVNKTHYDDPELLEINTLQNAIYMSMRNDVSFIIDSRLSLYEHQSTYSPNLPIRYLLYVADIYANITKNENLYGTKKVMIPPPRFLIFYNGRAPYPERKILKLSELYAVCRVNEVGRCSRACNNGMYQGGNFIRIPVEKQSGGEADEYI